MVPSYCPHGYDMYDVFHCAPRGAAGAAGDRPRGPRPAPAVPPKDRPLVPPMPPIPDATGGGCSTVRVGDRGQSRALACSSDDAKRAQATAPDALRCPNYRCMAIQETLHVIFYCERASRPATAVAPLPLAVHHPFSRFACGSPFVRRSRPVGGPSGRLMLIGEGFSGKTATFNSLAGVPLEAHEKNTLGAGPLRPTPRPPSTPIPPPEVVSLGAPRNPWFHQTLG